ncbi:MAG TPA: iron ABC transporter permease [bacterium]|nr:iron ABC transporter permease [bacterium]
MKNPRRLITPLIASLAVLIWVEIFIGPVGLSFPDVLAALASPGSADGVIIWDLRIPRIAYALCVGSGLAVCGLALQGLFRNPLAEPFTLGISGGAALGAVLVLTTGLQFGSLGMAAASFLGALAVCVIVYLLAARTLFSATALILGGVMLGFFAQSGVLLAIALAPGLRAQGAMMWLMGDMSYAPRDLLLPTLALTLAGVIFLFRQAAGLNVLSLGDEKATSLGLNVPRLRRNVFLWCSLITGATVAVLGIIGFVGLIIPNAIRRLAGGDHRTLFPLSALAGACFILVCDVLARSVLDPVELPLGIVTGFVGSLTFLWIFVSRKRI